MTDNQRDEAEREACCMRVNQALGRYSHWSDDSNITLRIGDLREFARQSPQAERVMRHCQAEPKIERYTAIPPQDGRCDAHLDARADPKN